jgi:hypothetical protein
MMLFHSSSVDYSAWTGSHVLWFRRGGGGMGFFPLGLYSWDFIRKHCGCGISFLFPMIHLAYVVVDFVKYTLYC